jgi:hypothetical protein
VLLIDLRAFRLAIGAEGAANVRTFVPGQADPAQSIEDHLLGGGNEAGTVGVLNAENELSTTLPGNEKIDEANVGGADVRVPSGRRGNADARSAG